MLAKILQYAMEALGITNIHSMEAKALQKDMEDAFAKLRKAGVIFVAGGALSPVVANVPRNSIGIKMWGKVDYLLRYVPGGRHVVVDTRVQSYEERWGPRTARVKDVRKEKLEKREELAAKKPWKYQAAR